MSFTTITVEADFKRPNGEPSQGTVTALLSATMTNGTQQIDPTPIVGHLNGAGELKSAGGLPFTLEANDDTSTEPGGTYYTFTVELDESEPRSFANPVPHAAAGGKITL